MLKNKISIPLCLSWASLILNPVQLLAAAASTIDTTGASFDLGAGTTWDGGAVPGSADTANFVHPGTYTAAGGAAFSWYGMQASASGTLEINPGSGGNAYTIHLGRGGIAGTEDIDRLGVNLTIDVGANDQTWSSLIANVQAVIAGSARITYTGNGRLWLRGNNTFTGTWQANGANSGIHPDTRFHWSSSLGAEAELLNDGYIRLSNTFYDRIDGIHLIGDGRLLTSGNSTDNGAFSSLQAAVTLPDSGDIYGSGDLTISSNLSYGKIELQADIYHGGDTIIDNKAAGMTLELAATSTCTFTIRANGVTNRIRGLNPATSKLNANGTFIFDRAGADLSNGNSWTVVDTASLNETFGPSFSVSGFTAEADGLTWTAVEEGHTWTFDESTGTLSVSDGGTPPPTPKHDVFFMGGQSNAKVDVAAGIADALRMSGQFDEPTVVWNRHSGQPIARWFDGGPREFYDEDLFGQSGTYDQDGQIQGLLEKEINSAGGPHPFLGFFWWQGEADANASGTYTTKFLGLMDQLATDLGQAIGTGADQWTYHIALPDDVARSYEAIRDAQMAMVDANPSDGTYADTRAYPRLHPEDNPHVPQDLDYFIGVDMANQFLALRGLPAVDLGAAPDSTVVKADSDELSQNLTTLIPEYAMLNRASAWLPEGIPGATNILRFDSTLTSSRTYYLGGTSYTPSIPSGTGGAFSIKGIDYQAPYQVILERLPLSLNNTLSIGTGGVDAGSATSRLIINVDVETPVAQTWTVASGQSILFNNPSASVDLRNANLLGGGTIDIRAGTVDLGSQPNTAAMSFYIGGPNLVFSAASDADLSSPLGTDATLRTGSASDASFTYNGFADASWNRTVNFDTIPFGRNATFEVSQTGATFSSTGSFGVHDTVDTLNLKLGGAGNLIISGTGGVKTNGTAVCNLEKTGSGLLKLSGSGNTFNGSLNITSGKVVVDAAASINTSSQIEVGSASTTATLEYDSSVGLDRDVTVHPGSTFIYRSERAYTGTLTVQGGGIVIVDGAFGMNSLEIPAGALLVLRSNASLPSGLSMTNSGTVDISTWNGTLPAGFVNTGAIIDASVIKIDSFNLSGSQLDIGLYGYTGHSYQLQRSLTLQPEDWQDVGNPTVGADAPMLFSPSAAGEPKVFYRVTVDQ